MAQVAMTREELERTMRVLEPVYDVVRVVDPNHMEGSTLGSEGELDLPHRCYDILNKGRRCQNCISARTVSCKHSVSKFEFVGDDAFYISTRYVEVDGAPRAIELVKAINEETLAPPTDDEAQEMRNIMEHDANHRYRDDRTDALGRAYLEDGIKDLVASRLAMLRVTGVEVSGQAGRDTTLCAIANAITDAIRNTDTLVRYEQATFVVVFESISHPRLRTMLEQMLANVKNALALVLGADKADVAIGAVLRDGTILELMEKAQDALERAAATEGRIVLEVAAPDERAEAQHAVGDVPSLGTHAQDVDALTGMMVPTAFRAELQGRLDEYDAWGQPLSIVHLDIENFKAFNRTYGLPEGDLLLVRLADLIRREFGGDLVTRMGVDTFVVATTRGNTRSRAERICTEVDTLRRGAPIALKAGICRIVNDRLSALLAMERAKIACDSIKGAYNASVRLFDNKLKHEVTLRDHLVKSLDVAIAQGSIRPYYQVIVRSFTGKACAVEVLSRWVDPTYGIISPGEVIPTLERHHLIHKHDTHIVRCACSDLRSMMDQGLDVVPLSLNLSRLDFELCDIFAEVEASAQEFDIPRSLIGIEITESTLEQAGERFNAQIDKFREAGYEIWMDDFGSGYSSLNVLKDYQFDVLKIDMAFLRGFEENRNSKKIIRSIVDMAKRLGVRTLAEGVESDEQFRFLRSIGCEMIQGFLFSRPVPIDEMELGEFAGVEDEAERCFLDKVGRVNLLSQRPAEGISPNRPTSSTAADAPFAIVEWNGNHFRYFTTNDAYLRSLQQRGFADLWDAHRQLNQSRDLRDWLAAMNHQRDERDGTYSWARKVVDVGHSMVTVEFIARHEDSIALLVSPQPAMVG